MTLNQLSIFLENRAGTLTKVLDIFKEAGLHIIASSIADTAQYGLVRIICSEPQRAYLELERNGVAVAMSDVFAIELDERPGQIAEIVRGLSEAEIGIVYMYSFFIHGKGLLFIRTDKTEEARDVIQPGPVQSIGKVPGIPVGVHEGTHVVRDVLLLLFHCAHVGRELHGQEAGGLGGAGHEVQHGLVLHAEGDEDGVGVRLELGKDHWTGGSHHDHDRLVAHLFLRQDHEVQVLLIESGDGLALVGTVREILLRIAAGNGLLPGVFRLVGPVLEADGHVTVAAFLAVVHVIAATRLGLLDDHEGEIGLFGLFSPVVVLLDKRLVDRVVPVTGGAHGQSEHAGHLREVALRNEDLFLPVIPGLTGNLG